MKAALLTGVETFEIQDIPQPHIESSDQVLIKVCAVGICGSDIHYYTDGAIGRQRVIYPFIIGHECSGRVVEIGNAVKNVKPGDSVIIDPAISCGKCSQCLSGRYHTCLHLSFIGCPGQQGGALCEYLVLPASACHSIPLTLPLSQAILAEPLAIALHSLSFLTAPRKATIAVLGCGPIGLSVIRAAQTAGIPQIFATDKIEERIRTAALTGIHGTGDAGRDDIGAKFTASAPQGFDAVFECCGQQEAIDQATDLLKPGGQLIIIGIPDIAAITFGPHVIRRKEISINNVRRHNQCMRQAIDLLSVPDSDFGNMVTHTYPLQDTSTAFQLVKNYADGVIKAVVTP